MASFQDWLNSLPSNETLAPTPGAPRGTQGYVRGVPAFLGQNQVPAIWKAFAGQGASLIDEETLARLSSQTAGIANGRREFERGLLGAYQQAGLDPLFARRQLAESRPMVGQQIQAARGEIEANRFNELFGLQSGVTNALTQSYLGERDLWLALNEASLGRKASRDGQQRAFQSQLFGMAGGALGSIFGGPLGGMVGNQLGGLMGGANSLGSQMPYGQSPTGIYGR